MTKSPLDTSSAALPFGDYAEYYDLFYESKNYDAECRFVENVSRRSEPSAKTVLDLGCGTGGHAVRLAQRGYQVTGVDRSPVMLRQARTKSAHGVEWVEGDLRSVRLGRRFDAVICMFAVLGYQTSNDDLSAALRTVRDHLTPGGLFLFDCWYGPGVLAARPETRVADFVHEGHRIMRIARPDLDSFRHLISIRYRIVRTLGDRIVDDVEETHCMRFFFAPELRHFFEAADLRLDNLWPTWDMSRPPNETDWNIVGLAYAV